MTCVYIYIYIYIWEQVSLQYNIIFNHVSIGNSLVSTQLIMDWYDLFNLYNINVLFISYIINTINIINMIYIYT